MEYAQPEDDIVIAAADLSAPEKEIAYSIARFVGEAVFKAVDSLPPEVRPYALAVGMAQVTDILTRQRRDVFGPGPEARPLGAPGDATPIEGSDYFQLLNTMPLSEGELIFASDVTVKMMQVVLALEGCRPANVRPFAIMAGLAELLRNMEMNGKWGPENRRPGMPGPDGKPMD